MVSRACSRYGSTETTVLPRMIRGGARGHMLGSYTTLCTGPIHEPNTSTKSGSSLRRSPLLGHHAPSIPPRVGARSHNASRATGRRWGAESAKVTLPSNLRAIADGNRRGGSRQTYDMASVAYRGFTWTSALLRRYRSHPPLAGTHENSRTPTRPRRATAIHWFAQQNAAPIG